MRMTLLVATLLAFHAWTSDGIDLMAQGTAASADHKQILGLDQALGKAVADGDAASWDKLTADDYQFTSVTGAFLTKADRLESFKKGPVPGFQTYDHRIRIYANSVAVVTGQQGGGVRFTRVWVKQGSDWRVVADQATLTQKPK